MLALTAALAVLFPRFVLSLALPTPRSPHPSLSSSEEPGSLCSDSDPAAGGLEEVLKMSVEKDEKRSHNLDRGLPAHRAVYDSLIYTPFSFVR